jgi:hypothetical protein
MSIIKDCSRLLTVSLSNDSPSLQLFADAFEKLQNEYANEFTIYSLDTAIIAIITPVVSVNHLSPINPLFDTFI